MISMRMHRLTGLLLGAMLAAGCQTMTGKSAGQNVDDMALTASVKAKLVGSDMENLTRVDVDVERGQVILSGIVQNAEEKQEAEQLAGQVSGVQEVVNNLQVDAQSS